MEQRPKRIISKPLRYQTTSSDESSKRRRTASATAEDIDKDINDLRRAAQKMDNETNYFSSQSHTLKQNQTSYTHTHIPKHTNDQFTNVELHTVIQPPNNNQLYSEIRNQTHTNTESYTHMKAYDMNMNDKTYTNLQPQKNFEVYSEINSPAYTAIQSHTDIEHDMYSQTNTDIQLHSHTNVQSYDTNNLTHTNFTPNAIKTYPRHNISVPKISQTCNINSTHNYISHIETGKTIYTNDVLFEFQDNREHCLARMISYKIIEDQLVVNIYTQTQ